MGYYLGSPQNHDLHGVCKTYPDLSSQHVIISHYFQSAVYLLPPPPLANYSSRRYRI